MIKLLDEKDICKRGDGVRDLNNHFDKIIQSKLQEGLEKQELIYTQDLRSVGKTYELIQFAKKNNLVVVVPTVEIAEELKRKYYYNDIYSQGSIRGMNFTDIIVDEDINIEMLKNIGKNILTGFSDKNNKIQSLIVQTSDSISIKVEEDNNLISVLDNEVNELVKIILKTRENCDFGTYKNKILALKEVLGLKNAEIEKNWQLMYSEYTDGDNGQKQVAVWEQNGNGQIRNHKVWDIKDSNKNNSSCLTINGTLHIENKAEIEQAIKDLEYRVKNIKVGVSI